MRFTENGSQENQVSLYRWGRLMYNKLRKRATMLKEWTRKLLYNPEVDLLYIRLDDRTQPVVNERLSDDIVLDVGENDKIVGIEILAASKHLNLEKLLPTK